MYVFFLDDRTIYSLKSVEILLVFLSQMLLPAFFMITYLT